MQQAVIEPGIADELSDELVLAAKVAQRRFVKAVVENGRLLRAIVRARDKQLAIRAKEASSR